MTLRTMTSTDLSSIGRVYRIAMGTIKVVGVAAVAEVVAMTTAAR